MRSLIIAATATVTLLTAAPLFAQEPGQNAGGYVTGVGGFTSSIGDKTGNMLFEGGGRIAPHVMVFGDIGRYGNLKAELQPTLDATTANLATNQGLAVIGSGKLPASYFGGGVRIEIPTKSRIMPYVLGGVDVAHLSPAATFTFSSGTLPDGTTPDIGTDVTSAIVSAGSFTAPATSNASMITLGGGVEVLANRHWVADAGYRYARIAAVSSLSATPLTTNGLIFGFGYRF